MSNRKNKYHYYGKFFMGKDFPKKFHILQGTFYRKTGLNDWKRTFL